MKRKWTIASLDLDWRAQNPETVPNNGYEILAEYLDEGGQVLGVWWEPRTGARTHDGFARVLLRVPVRKGKA